jgi:Mn2+/Fe2+ NRAMP family transporter
LYGIVGLLLAANTINIAADISAMGNAFALIAGGHAQSFAVCFGAISLVLEIVIPYSRYVRILKWLTLGLLAYVATILVVRIPGREVLLRTLLPHLSWNSEYVTTVVAVFGTTISPYLFFWQAAQEVEDRRAAPRAHSLRKSPDLAKANLHRIKVDTYIGMGFSNLVAYFIILTTAVTLHLHGVTDIQTSEQAAAALRPLAGDFAFTLFSLGIIGTGMLAIPVLAGSAAYAMAEAFKWRSGLELKPERAKKFYAIIALSTLIGVMLGFTPFNPIKALFWSAVINGVISVPIMIVMMLMSVRPDIMGRYTVTRRLQVLGWLATGIMTVAVIAMFGFMI